jgi:hypothetical protein
MFDQEMIRGKCGGQGVFKSMSWHMHDHDVVCLPHTIDENCPESNVSLKDMELKPHQKKMLYCMEQFENEEITVSSVSFRTKYGIVGDKVGSGKSMCVLSLLSKHPRIPSRATNEIVHRIGSSQFEMVFVEKREYIPLNIIVVPHGIFHQWKVYVERYTNLCTYFIHRKKQITDCLFTPDFWSPYTVLLISSTMFGELGKHPFWSTYGFERLIVDEIDSITIPCMPTLNPAPHPLLQTSVIRRTSEEYVMHCKFSWYLTASYKTLCYPSSFNRIRHRFGFEMQTPLLILNNASSVIDASFRLPETITKIVSCYHPTIDVLHDIVSPEIFQSICAGDTQKAVELLGCSSCSSEKDPDFLSLVCTSFDRELRNLYLEKTMVQEKYFSSETLRQEHLDRIEQKIQEIHTKQSIVKNRLEEETVDPISTEEIRYPIITKCCQHKFDISSILDLMKHRRVVNPPCPFCRTLLSKDQLLILTSSSSLSSAPMSIVRHNKYDMFRLWLLEHYKVDTSRILVFSERDVSLNEMSDLFTELSCTYHRICGSSTRIESMVRDFREGRCPILLLNATLYGAGLNLECCSDLVLLHSLDSNTETQVIGRCQRYGRVDPLRIWKFRYPKENV